eukprot:Lithocolla_globosa_v1_NODE_1172_length_2812_cov_87.653609.p2 type:complete len:117 gc:universal NODE_1172_length_2812_cov_87.653609:464-814(+)
MCNRLSILLAWLRTAVIVCNGQAVLPPFTNPLALGCINSNSVKIWFTRKSIAPLMVLRITSLKAIGLSLSISVAPTVVSFGMYHINISVKVSMGSLCFKIRLIISNIIFCTISGAF